MCPHIHISVITNYSCSLALMLMKESLEIKKKIELVFLTAKSRQRRGIHSRVVASNVIHLRNVNHSPSDALSKFSGNREGDVLNMSFLTKEWLINYYWSLLTKRKVMKYEFCRERNEERFPVFSCFSFVDLTHGLICALIRTVKIIWSDWQLESRLGRDCGSFSTSEKVVRTSLRVCCDRAYLHWNQRVHGALHRGLPYYSEYKTP